MIAGGKFLTKAFLDGIWNAYRGNSPIHPDQLHIGANSIDVTLNPTILLPDANKELDLKAANSCHYNEHTIDPLYGWVIYPHGFLLGSVNERFDSEAPLSIKIRTENPSLKRTGYKVVSQPTLFTQTVHGRSTLGRCGLCIHATAGYGDFGFKGAFTLEIFNVTNRPIRIYSGIKVAQVEFNSVHKPLVYSGSYIGEHHYDGPVAPDLKGRF